MKRLHRNLDRPDCTQVMHRTKIEKKIEYPQDLRQTIKQAEVNSASGFMVIGLITRRIMTTISQVNIFLKILSPKRWFVETIIWFIFRTRCI